MFNTPSNWAGRMQEITAQIVLKDLSLGLRVGLTGYRPRTGTDFAGEDYG